MDTPTSTNSGLLSEGDQVIDRAAGRRRSCSAKLVLGTLLLAWAGVRTLAQPFATTQAPGPVTGTTATLNGMATPNGVPTIAWFEWGTDAGYGQTNSPVDVGDGLGVVRVSALITGLAPGAIYHYRLVSSNTLGQVMGADRPLTTGRKLTAWGFNVSGLTNDARRFGRVVAIGSGSRHALAVIADGAVVAWGENTRSQTKVPTGLSNAVAVAGGGEHSMALRADGTVLAWGSNLARQTNTPAGLRDVAVIACGWFHNLALKTDGTVVAWGQNNAGQTNVPAGLSNVVGLAAGRMHSLAMKADGTVVGWGSNGGGAISVPLGLSNVVALAAGEAFSLALRADGTVLGWGTNSSGQITVPPDLSNVVAIAAGRAHCLALKRDGTVVAWGSNSSGQTNVPSGLSNVVAIAAGSEHSLALGSPSAAPYAHTQPAGPVTATAATLNGMATPNSLPTTAWFEWGPDSGYGQTTAATDVGDGVNVVRVSAPLAGLTAGRVYHYRLVSSNQLGVAYGAATLFTTGLKAAFWGDPSAGNGAVPAEANNVVAVAGGHGHSLALKPDGTVLAWGGGGTYPQHYGEVIDFGQTNVPVGLSNVIALAGGYLHSLALKSDGSVVAWGTYSKPFSRDYRTVDVPIGLTDVVAVAGGDGHSMALKAEGTVAVWGLGSAAYVPTGLNNLVAITAGAYHCLALQAEGAVVAWGDNSHGQTQVPAGLSNVVAISSSVWHCLALKADGTVVGWGNDWYGQATVPAGLSNVIAVAAGQYHSLALKADGTIVGWGDNEYGQTNVPTGLSQVAAISSGDLHCLALAANAPPQPSPCTVTGPMNQDSVVPPPCFDPNADPLTYRLVSLPAVGTLFQFTLAGRGAPISTADTQLSDPLGRVIFAPAADEFGLPYASFSVVANDGQYDSTPGTATLNVLPAPVIESGAYGFDTNGVFALGFAGLTNATYSVYASTDLTNWSWLGSPNQPTPGQFLFSDSASTNYPWRFYQVRSP